MVRTKAMARKWTGRAGGEAVRMKIVVSCPPGVKVPHRYEPGTAVERDMARFSRNPDFVIPKSLFQRIVRNITWDIKRGIKFQSAAVMALQQVSEEYLAKIFRDAAALARHVNRSKVKTKDLQLCLLLKTH
ncbi:hypothetical protein QAD02_020450 [Eretmocerus hayati]|uniref:Uncharacterized protein n=1 Tax=Eretmocerus hayati TaxID=131215 RepID=A0ACC2PQN0_9HYME|nr:hypothetical protein QAD02_020450 [Eretmocerus hayati]